MRSVGIGRNEYISIMNRCKAKKLLWRVNKAIVKEMLPTEPVDIEMQPWWMVNVVNLGALPIAPPPFPSGNGNGFKFGHLCLPHKSEEGSLPASRST